MLLKNNLNCISDPNKLKSVRTEELCGTKIIVSIFLHTPTHINICIYTLTTFLHTITKHDIFNPTELTNVDKELKLINIYIYINFNTCSPSACVDVYT